MAPKSSSKRNFSHLYKQKKKTATKKPSRKKSNTSISHDVIPQDENEINEMILKQFDMNMEYGPCVGLKRLERWERAKSIGLSPPEEVFNLLKSDKAQQQSLWNHRLV